MHHDKLRNVLLFIHQDIAFDDEKWLLRIEKELAIDPNQILGFAGMLDLGHTVSNLRYQRTKKFITKTQIENKTEVCSVDECCFAMAKSLYDRLKFDEITCNHWHLYAVDFCYDSKRKFTTRSFVLPESIYHKEDGTSGLYTDCQFLWTLWKMTRKYRRTAFQIKTPCYIIHTNPIKAFFKITKTIVKNIIKR